jgi:hypothetical protein
MITLLVHARETGRFAEKRHSRRDCVPVVAVNQFIDAMEQGLRPALNQEEVARKSKIKDRKIETKMQLPNYRIYLKLMIGGVPSKPFSAITLADSKSGGVIDSHSEASFPGG